MFLPVYKTLLHTSLNHFFVFLHHLSTFLRHTLQIYLQNCCKPMLNLQFYHLSGPAPEGRVKVANEVDNASLDLLVPASASPFSFLYLTIRL